MLCVEEAEREWNKYRTTVIAALVMIVYFTSAATVLLDVSTLLYLTKH